MRYGDPLLSRPVELHWAGWRSDTFTLQQHGWQISAEQDVCRMQMMMALRNERAGMSGVTARVDWRYMDDMRFADSHRHMPPLPVHLMGRKIEVMHTMGNAWENFNPIDAQPQFTPNREIRSLEDMVHFAPAHTRTQQLIVPEDSVDSLMARILEMQQGPRIERIRQEIREGDRIDFTAPRQKFHAQIISLAS
ncbi:hypothetical protein [Mesorhizobium sp. M1252]|uniref:hypothetical protein n=1 Tax=Mesorhizobium sp. M1252 TaxID=2957073 RepID=UPI00333D4007